MQSTYHLTAEWSHLLALQMSGAPSDFTVFPPVMILKAIVEIKGYSCIPQRKSRQRRKLYFASHLLADICRSCSGSRWAAAGRYLCKPLLTALSSTMLPSGFTVQPGGPYVSETATGRRQTQLIMWGEMKHPIPVCVFTLGANTGSQALRCEKIHETEQHAGPAPSITWTLYSDLN